MASGGPPKAEDCGHRLGNFWNYYSFNPVGERLQYLPDEIVTKLLGKHAKEDVPHYCDLGCNEGDLSIGVQEMLSTAINGEGCSISESQSKRLKMSAKEPAKDDDASPTICGMLGVDVDQELIRRGNEKAKSRGLGASVKFEVVDLSSPSDDTLQRYLEAAGITRFSCIFCFSMTMWIHLNHGDDGLKQFLKYDNNIFPAFVGEFSSATSFKFP
jgi:hypothetical protein